MKSLIPLLFATTLIACSDDPESADCSDGDVRCDADVLQECGAEGWADAEDCAASGMMCHEEMGHCMEMTEG